MARRSSSPPLYELISTARRKRQGEAAPAEREPEVVASASPSIVSTEAGGPTESVPGQRLAPGQAIRVPVGYVFLATAGLLIVAVFAYMIGHHRGAEAMQAEYDQVIVDAQSGHDTARSLRDPLAATPARPTDRLDPAVEPGGGDGPAGRPDRVGPTLASGGDGSEEWGPVESDPRRRGLHYLVLATTRPQGAIRLARFCRGSGLEAYVIDGDNSRRRRVIALPGFPTRSRSDPAVRAVRERIADIGRRWKIEHRGESDLSDNYMSLYEG